MYKIIKHSFIQIIKKILVRVIFIFFDLSAIASAYIFSYYARFNWFIPIFPADKGIPEFKKYLEVIPFLLLIWFVLFLYEGMYKRIFIPASDDLLRIIKNSFLSTIIIMATSFIYRGFEYSRLVVAISLVFTSGLVFITRYTLKSLIDIVFHRILPSHKVLLIGNGKVSDVIHKYLKRQPSTRIIQQNKYDQNLSFALLKNKSVDEVLISEYPLDIGKYEELIDHCEEKNIPIKVVPDLLEMRLGSVVIDDSWGIPVMNLKYLSLHGVNRFIKKTFDIFFSITFFALTLPLWIFICYLIKIDSRGFILYVNWRCGFKNKKFKFFKFRTMHKDSDKRLKDLLHLSDREGPVFKLKSDPRVTRVGRFLRKFSLDELPQFLNVLRGEMSIVGPRPQVVWEAEFYDEVAKKRLNILPGITGLWQVSGRADIPYEEMIAMDLYYLENWSLGLDLKLILKTLPAVLSRKGAY